MDTVRATLTAAIASGDAVEFQYNGGSTPGKQRRVIPLTIKDDLLSAKDIETGKRKSYKLSLIAFAVAPHGSEPVLRVYGTLHDLLLLEQSLILRTNLFVLADRFHIKLYTQSNPVSTTNPLFYIQYDRYLIDPVGTKVESTKPWKCNGTSYSTLQPAAEAFVRALWVYAAR